MATPIRLPEPDVPAPLRRRPRRRRRAGPRWLDFSIGATALVVSAASLLVARHQAQVMDRQLAASVWPSLRAEAAYSGSEGDSGGPTASLSLESHGTGPARLQSLRVSYRGRPLRNAHEVLAVCCHPDTTRGAVEPKLLTSEQYVVGRVMSPGEHLDWFLVHFVTAGSPVTARAYQASQGVIRGISTRVCYCSVLDDCWVAESGTPEPASAASCAEEQKQVQYR